MMKTLSKAAILILAVVTVGCYTTPPQPTGVASFEQILELAKHIHATGDYELRAEHTDYSNMSSAQIQELKKEVSKFQGRTPKSNKTIVTRIFDYDEYIASGETEWEWNIKPEKIILIREEGESEISLGFTFGAFEKDGRWFFSKAIAVNWE